MVTSLSPARSTILFGAGCGIFYLTLCMVQPYYFFSPVFFSLFVWGCVAGYGLLLVKWTKKRFVKLVLPLGLLLVMVFLISSKVIFIIMSALVLSWIRSRICFVRKPISMAFFEALFCGAGLLMVFAFFPRNMISIAMGILLFFLIQSLYFLAGTPPMDEKKEQRARDPFETAFQAAQDILSSDVPFHDQGPATHTENSGIQKL